MSNTEIKPCPFCGGRGEVKRISMRRNNDTLVFVKCTACHAEGHKIIENYDYEDKERIAVDAWNRRV